MQKNSPFGDMRLINNHIQSVICCPMRIISALRALMIRKFPLMLPDEDYLAASPLVIRWRLRYPRNHRLAARGLVLFSPPLAEASFARCGKNKTHQRS
jgi:hypothetical protein